MTVIVEVKLVQLRRRDACVLQHDVGLTAVVDLVLERDSELTAAPWAHRGDPRTTLRHWEPEPLRWLGYVVTNAFLQLEEWAHSRDAGVFASIASRSSAVMEKLRH